MIDPVSDEDWQATLRVLRIALDGEAALPDRAGLERLAVRIAKDARRKRRAAPASPEAQAERARQSEEDRAKAAAHDRSLLEGTSMQQIHLTGSAGDGRGGELRGPSRACHICGKGFREVDALYHRLCPPCARENRTRREQRVDLSGRVALVTGGRIKIGRATALRLLRQGARVLVTTRFTHDAAHRFAEEPDFAEWRQRLEIHALDFLDPRSVLTFAAGLEKTLPCLDILINNAAQTVKRPESFYEPALAKRRQALPPGAAALLGPGGSEVSDSSMTLIPWEGMLDRHGLPPDVRDHNSWTLRAHEVPPGELLEVLLVNAAGPAFLVSALKPLMVRSPRPDRFIVNATGTDGRFGVPSKPSTHPHVNMGKAALNMLTCTASADYAADRIHMNSVDTGWVSDESGHAARAARETAGWTPPLDMADAAARLCAPVHDGITGIPYSGQLLRHYHPAAW